MKSAGRFLPALFFCPFPSPLSTALGRCRHSGQTFGFREREATENVVSRQSLRQRTQQIESPRINPSMPTLEQQRISTLLHELRYEIGVAREGTARRQAAGVGSDEVYVGERTGLISGEI